MVVALVNCKYVISRTLLLNWQVIALHHTMLQSPMRAAIQQVHLRSNYQQGNCKKLTIII